MHRTQHADNCVGQLYRASTPSLPSPDALPSASMPPLPPPSSCRVPPPPLPHLHELVHLGIKLGVVQGHGVQVTQDELQGLVLLLGGGRGEA